MTTTSLTKNQAAALAYITASGYMLVNQQGLRSLPNGAKALVTAGLVKVEDVNFYGQRLPAYVLA